ncbi:hypothetical protein HDU76_012906 [Blyttiomyces sp. JEL0837]|nr:hypothetical protein HDU76_012906 [Blyttiomyces sp. JEL0837]
MSSIVTCERYAASLQNPNIDIEIKLKVVSDIRNTIDVVQPVEYAGVLQLLIPAFKHILMDMQPKIREKTLEIIHRFPQNEALRSHAPELMDMLMQLLRNENEDNAVICLKIIVDLQKNYKNVLEEYVHKFFDIVKEMYGNMEQAVAETFNDSSGSGGSARPEDEAMNTTPVSSTEGADSQRVLARSMFSFKVLTECPLIIALLLQMQREHINQHVPAFVPLTMSVLSLQPAPQKQAHEEAKLQGKIFVGVSPNIRNRTAYSEFRALQVKTASFIAYILRIFDATLRPHHDVIADSIVQLLKDCPPEASATRKELLVAVRHIWYELFKVRPDFRQRFVQHIDVLLNEDVLVGTGVTCVETLRPLAHTILVDQIYHIRNDLTKAQLFRTVHIYARNLHDATFAPNLQTMFAKLLLNLIDSIAAKCETDARALLFKILDAYAMKFTSTTMAFSSLLKYSHRRKSQIAAAGSFSDSFTPSLELDGFSDIGLVQPIRTSSESINETGNLDMRFLLKTLIKGIEPLLIAIRNCSDNGNAMVIQGAQQSSGQQNFSHEEVQIFIRIFRDGLKCFDYFISENFGPDGNIIEKHNDRISPSAAKEEKEVFESFAAIFTHVDPCIFQDVFASQIQYLFQSILHNPGLHTIPQYLLGLVMTSQNVNGTGPPVPNFTNVSPNFAGILLRFLVDRFEDLGSEDKTLSTTMLRLFKVVFMAVTRYPEKNEAVLRPHLGGIIMKSMKLSSKTKDPINYFLLLRALFRGIGGGRFEALYQEVLPLLEVLLEGLNTLLAAAQKHQMKELFVELCLTVPVRLSVLLPHLSLLMKPLVVALKGNPELVSQGLRTLELCIDNLTQEFLEPIFNPVIHELMEALGTHLKPLPYKVEHSHTTMRILGKLGGRNRRLLYDAPKLNYLPNSESGDRARAAHVKPGQTPGSCDSNNQGNWLFYGNAVIIPSLKEQATELVQNLCRHFAFLCVLESQESVRNAKKQSGVTPAIDNIFSTPLSKVDGFIDAIVNSITSESEEQRQFTEESLKLFYSVCKSLTVRMGNCAVDDLPVFHTLASRFCSCCYRQEWYKKNGGCQGISILTKELDLGLKWVLDHELDFVKALLYVLKDISPEMATANADEANQILVHVLSLCHKQENPEESPDRQAKFGSLISLLISELSNSNSAVRKTIQSTFQLLATLTMKEVTDLLTPVRERLLSPIFSKPLRALPFAMQIGHIDAITYCLTLRPPLLSFSDELIRLLHEALALADAEDQALVSKPTHYKNSASLTNLRVVCIKLLSAAMACPDFGSARHNTTRSRITSVFFKSLYSKSSEVVDVAYKGLRQVLNQQQRLPRDLLQAGLKPILVNLSDYKRLTVPALEGLARLLELLTNYFRVEIGRKLLDHLRQWADPVLLETASGRPLTEIDEIKIIVAILDVFYLLPASANIFLDDLVKVVLDLESRMRRTVSSPFRLPLVKFMNRYPGDSLDYFMEKIKQPPFASLFVQIVESKHAQPLRQELMEHPDKLLAATYGQIDEAHKAHLDMTAVFILKGICLYNPRWLIQQPTFLTHLRSHWQQVRCRGNAPQWSFLDVKEYTSILEIFISICKEELIDVQLLFDIVEAMTATDLVDISFLKVFIYEEVVMKYSPAQKRQILDRYFANFEDSAFSSALKASLLRYLILPMLMVSFLRQETAVIIDVGLVEVILRSVWNKPAIELDALKVELVQFTTLLIQFASQILAEIRKTIVTFGWKCLKSVDDVTSKHVSQVLLARFIQVYDTPTAIIIQLYVMLLKAHQAEGRVLVRQALDILIPALPARVGTAEGTPTWVRWTRKVVSEDGHSLSQMLGVYQLLVRHADIFYQHRNYFMPQLVSSLARLGLTQNATPETKLLSVELGEVILKWERQRLQETEVGRSIAQAEDPESDASFASQINYQEMLSSYIVRFVSFPNEPGVRSNLTPRFIGLLRAYLEVWPDINIKLSYFERVGSLNATEENIGIICDCLDMLLVILERKSHIWICANITQIQKCIEPWLSSESVLITKSLTPIVELIFKAISNVGANDTERTPEVGSFIKAIESVIIKGLQSAANVSTVISLLTAATAFRPEILDERIIADVMKVLQKLARDHISALPSTAVAASPGQVDTPVNVLLSLLHLLKHRIPYVKDHRRAFHDCLLQLVSESSDLTLLKGILQIVREWVANRAESFPTLKEKATLLVKMLGFEGRGDAKLLDDYLELIADIYSDTALARSELTVRLEQSFLTGTKAENPLIRRKFCDILNASMEESVFTRMNYVLGVQNWEPLAEYFWLRQALDLLIGSINMNDKLNCKPQHRILSDVGQHAGVYDAHDLMLDLDFKTHYETHKQFAGEMQKMAVASLLTPLRELIYMDVDLTAKLWTTFFPICWNLLHPGERQTITKVLIPLLAKDYHMRQSEARPNVISTLLEGVCKCIPLINLPPQLVKYAGKNFNAWYIALELLQNATSEQRSRSTLAMSKEEEKVRDNTMDAFADLLISLGEDDYFCGLWRRRCLFAETNAAISFQQCGLWSQAQILYENAQTKARSGVLPFTESEYILWEEHWILCAQRLQQWDILTDLAKHEGNSELLLECAWRLSDWIIDREALSATVKAIHDTKSPRKKMFEAFLLLQKAHDSGGDKTEFRKVCDEGIQVTLQNWFCLPSPISVAHVPLLHAFQMFVELHEAGQIQDNLLDTVATNIETKSQELKGILVTWRERLPNTWDDVLIWSDLVHWRQHVFTMVNKSYLPLIPHLTPPVGSGTNTASSYAYRGYHETAWIINRFSNVARKHQLTDVCMTSLSKIYTLPNIEIPEAFYKLREQAKCHFQGASEYASGLDVINNTNLHYFTATQKAEFWALKGIFFSKLNLHDEAAVAFATATQIDIALPKAWAAWGQYNDRMFKEQPTEMKYGISAINCYLHAAGIYNNSRSRKFLARILWLLSLDDGQHSLSKSYETFKGDAPMWYWITFIPQLLTSLANREAKYARSVLMKLAKTFPQALHFQLRTTKEDYTMIKKQAVIAATARAGETAANSSADVNNADQEAADPNRASAAPRRQPWEYVEEVMSLLKTAFPLLALSMETMVDQMAQRLKPTTDEDIYRLIVALLNDGVQQLARDPGDNGQLCHATEVNLARFAESMKPNHLKYKVAFEYDFIKSKPNLLQLVTKFREWRDKLENLLDSRPRKQHLEHFSHYLVEFEYQKFDDIEVPGQYFLLKDSNKDFIRIDRFQPEVEVLRGHGSCYRRLTIRGHDGSYHPFNVQHPAVRHCRREERIIQLFRILNSILERKKESRRRGLSFHLPLIVPLAPLIRLVQDDPSYTTLQEIYEDHCASSGIDKDDPILFHIHRMRELFASEDMARRGKVEILNLKTEIMEDIAARMIPETILSKFVAKSMDSYTDLWIMRKRFTNQMAAVTFMTHVLSIGHRYPQKFHISMQSGNVWASDLLPVLSNTNFLFSSTESVPFRLTPNLQHFMTPIGIEGVFTSSVIAIARSLVEPEYELDDFLSIFVRDELITWQNVSRKPALQEQQLRDLVNQNSDLVIKRSQALSCKAEREKGVETGHPVNQTILDLISQAGNPLKLAQMDPTFLAML